MDLVSIEQLVRDVADQVPNVPEPLVLKRLCSALRRFCLTSRAWQQDVLITLDGREAYEIENPENMRVHQVENVKVDDVELVDGSDYFSTRATVEPERPERWDTGNLFARVSLIPVGDVTDVPVSLFDHYRDVLVNGACAQLLAMPSTAWSNHNDALRHENDFEDGCIKAKTDWLHGFSHSRSYEPTVDFYA